ncbi:hypothetical protein [Novosphingobium sp.]|uniref:hypothetical protein n=1 Tax=Novosphingobium sp. TaxID=1874826 RepID=UPI0035B01963
MRALAVGAAALGLLVTAAPTAAQSITDYRLPGATTTQAPSNAQGPVDPDNPVVRQPVVRPTATPSPAPTLTQPAPAPSATPTVTRTPAASATRAAQPAPRPTAASPAAAPTIAAPAPGETATTLPATEAAAPASAPLGMPTLAAPAEAPTPSASGLAANWPWIAGALAVLVALFAAWWWRGRAEQTPRITFEPPVVPEPEPEPRQPSTPAPAPRLPEPQLSVAAMPRTGLAVALEARRLTASLVATTLNYTLKLTNHGAEPLTTLAVEGDMISAHASLPPEQQIASDAQRLELRHAAVSLEPGESVEFSGDFRLPLAAVTPIRAGEAAYFVPLARLRIEGSTAAGDNLVMVQTFVVGEVPEYPAAALRPFRLDLGPRTFTRIGQRAVA